MRTVRALIREMHRRSLWQVLGIFLAASWGVIEAVDLLTEQVGLPEWTPTMALVLLLVGLPVVLATAFVQEGLPGGEGVGGDPDADATAGGTADASGGPGPRPTPTAGGAPGTPLASSGEGTGASAADGDPGGVRRLFSWRNAILGGVGAFALLGMSVVGYFVLWSAGIGPVGNLVAQGVFEEGERVVLADFADGTDEDLGDVVTEAIRVDLQASPVIDLVSPSYVAGGLARMGRPRDAEVTGEVARELAVRDGLGAVIAGEVAPVGSGYLLTASLISAGSGEILEAFRVPVDSEDDLLDGIDRLSREIRETSGESLRSIARGVPLEEATTPSLAALRLYTEAERAQDEGRVTEVAPLLERALELDPEFAMAWRKLSVALSNAGQPGTAMREAAERAWELRDRLTEREALLAEAWWRSSTGDGRGAVAVYRRLLERHPQEPTALNNLSVRLVELGRYDEAEEVARRLVEAPAPPANAYLNFVDLLWRNGKEAEAERWADSLSRRYPGSIVARRSEAATGFLLGEWGAAHEAALTLRGELSGGEAAFNHSVLAGIDLARGRYLEAVEHLDVGWGRAVELESPQLVLFPTTVTFVNMAWALEGPQAGRAVMDELLDAPPVGGLGPGDPLWADVALLLAALGDTLRGDSLIAAWEGGAEPDRGVDVAHATAEYAAARALGTGAWAEFLRLLEQMRTASACRLCDGAAILGIAHEETGDAEAALEQYRRHLRRISLPDAFFSTGWDAPVLERMARLHARRGEPEPARRANLEIVSRFEDGDGPYPAFVQRARARLAASGG